MLPRSFRTLAFVLLAASSVPTSAMAARPFAIEARGGLALAKIRTTYPLDVLETLKSFTGGAGVAWPIGSALEVAAEALFVEKGVSLGKAEGTDSNGNVTGTLEMLWVYRVIEIPVLARWNVVPEGVVQPNLFLGPFISFEAAEQFKFTGSRTGTEDFDVLKSTDFGLVLGGGLRMPAGPVRWIVDARYDLGLADLGDFYGSNAARTGAFALSTGVRF